MKKVILILIVLSLVAAFVICGKAFTQKDASDSPESVKASKTTEAIEATEPAEAIISYSDAYNNPDSGANPVDVVEDAE